MLLKEDYEDCDGECRAELELRDSGEFFFSFPRQDTN